MYSKELNYTIQVLKILQKKTATLTLLLKGVLYYTENGTTYFVSFTS